MVRKILQCVECNKSFERRSGQVVSRPMKSFCGRGCYGKYKSRLIQGHKGYKAGSREIDEEGKGLDYLDILARSLKTTRAKALAWNRQYKSHQTYTFDWTLKK